MSTLVETLPAGSEQSTRTAASQATRIFRMGSIDIPDIAPEMKPLPSLRQHCGQWPHLRHATLAEPYMEGRYIIYEVESPPLKTKGCAMSRTEARSILQAWAHGQERALPAEAAPSSSRGPSWPLSSSQRVALRHLVTNPPNLRAMPPPLHPLWLPLP
jgi:hypothetical protein